MASSHYSFWKEKKTKQMTYSLIWTILIGIELNNPQTIKNAQYSQSYSFNRNLHGHAYSTTFKNVKFRTGTLNRNALGVKKYANR